MNNLEKNNINTQVILMKDIITNYKHITYSVTEVGKKLREHLATKKINDEEKTVTISKEVFDKMLDIAYILQDEKKFEQLGILAQSAVPDNEIKIKILNQLQA
jgi:hypothetical protein